ncbi:MAG: radical SAM family heme chaperone HemW [Lachnospiraceae bacterium]|nr:radical SAM family heme chaperone HemW [Lachnospiraceae bacterium]
MKTERLRSLGIYIHIPFCVRKCKYCDFLSLPIGAEPISLVHEGEREKMIRTYFKALENEIENKSAHFREKNYTVDTIYIGGGTPSVVPASFIFSLLEKVYKALDVESDAEVSIEVNPGTLKKSSLELYRKAGINRISIGVQSTNNADLVMLGRIHSREDFLKSYDEVLQAGFENINLDLMHSVPGQSLDRWKSTLEDALWLKPDHISAYSLIVEDGTYFKTLQDEGKLRLPDEDTALEIYRFTNTFLEENGFKRYEISNFAVPGRESRHNLRYWDLSEYLGVGLGASSFLLDRSLPDIKGLRLSNTRDMKEYLDSGQNALSEAKTLDRDRLMEEYLFLGLRKTEGIFEERFEKLFGISLREVYGAVIEKQVKEGVARFEDGRLHLTERGMEVANPVMAEYLRQ